ncbi:helix-turn-helix domain-containing protein [Flavobacterium ajazii]|uniref:helix-turn-helix domain-containing protein n=1 Tax=Flavobacterium ajazii TaxID=2692318 RepID=UPI0013D62784|nr:helix-turn-helix domain-containing protein [Flavobacterium ajazii]
MKTNQKIKTYESKDFRDKFLVNEAIVDDLFKFNSDHFFCLKLEDVNDYFEYSVPPSKHICHTLLLITSGENIIKIGFEEYVTKANEAIIVAANQVFSIDTENTKKTGFICQFHPDILIGKYGNREIINDFDFLKLWGKPNISFNEKEAHFILQLLSRLEIQYRESGMASLDIIQSYLITLLCEINETGKKTVKENKNLTAAMVLTTKFKELLYTHIKKEHGVGFYASLLNVTPNHLNKSLKNVTGKSPAKWIDETILLEAKYLLYQTNLSVSEIALQVGYYDQSYFSRIFKKQEGITPVQYRKLIEKS